MSGDHASEASAFRGGEVDDSLISVRVVCVDTELQEAFLSFSCPRR